MQHLSSFMFRRQKKPNQAPDKIIFLVFCRESYPLGTEHYSCIDRYRLTAAYGS
jgi:hypothetical protein